MSRKKPCCHHIRLYHCHTTDIILTIETSLDSKLCSPILSGEERMPSIERLVWNGARRHAFDTDPKLCGRYKNNGVFFAGVVDVCAWSASAVACMHSTHAYLRAAALAIRCHCAGSHAVTLIGKADRTHTAPST